MEISAIEESIKMKIKEVTPDDYRAGYAILALHQQRERQNDNFSRF